MLLVLSDDQKEHLALLSNVDEEIAKEFCRIAVDFIKNGVNMKKYHTAAQKLSLEARLIRESVEAIMHILSECAKLEINEVDFKDSVLAVGLSQELNDCLLEFYLDNRDEIRGILDDMSLVLPHYDDLEWRFDVQLASRSLSYQTVPKIMMKFHLKSGVKEDMKVLQTDPVNLLHMTQVLEGALAEIKSAHCRRITRNIK